MFSFVKGVLKPYFNSEGLYITPWDNQVACLVKRFNADNSSAPFYPPKFFSVVESASPTSLEEVGVLLERYTKDPNVALLRGVPIEDSSNGIARNTGTFNCKHLSNIIHMDIDSIYTEFTELEDQAQQVLRILANVQPDMFSEGLAYIVKASASARIKEGIRMHMYLQADRPVSNAQLKHLALSINTRCLATYGYELLDPSVYDQVHLLYTSDPQFADINTNPFKDISRFAYRLEGLEVTLPEVMPEIALYNNIRLNQEYMCYTEDIGGLHSMPSARMDSAMSRFLNATDNVFVRHAGALYVTAVEEGVDLKWLDSKVLPHLMGYSKVKGNRSAQAYISNAKNFALSRVLGRSLRSVGEEIDVSPDPTISSMFPIEHLTSDSNASDRYLSIKKLPPKDTVTFIKASLGTGKTTTVQKWLSQGLVLGRVLAVTNTVSLVAGNARKLGSGIYSSPKDRNEFSQGKISRMSTTIHSLRRFGDTVRRDGLEMLFIDEADAVMNDILFSEVIRDREKLLATLIQCMNKATYVILSDGDISPETIEAYAKLCSPAKPVNVYIHNRKMLAKASAIEVADEKSVWSALQGYLEIGEKCLLVSDYGPDELNLKGALLRESTGANVKEVHRNSTKDVDIKEILTYGNASLIQQDVDALLCSPSVTSGVDFSYFDAVFLVTRDASIHTPNLRFQALRRDRTAKTIYYYTAKTAEGFKTGHEHYDGTAGWEQRCRKIFAERKQRECKGYRSTLRMLLRDQGCKVDIDHSDWGELESCPDIRAQVKEERICAILTSTPTSLHRRHGDAFEVKQDIVRYYDEVYDFSGVTHEIVKRFLKEKPNVRAAFFHKIVNYFWVAMESCADAKSWNPLRDAILAQPQLWYQYTGLDTSIEYSKRNDKGVELNTYKLNRFNRYLTMMGLIVDQPGEYAHIIHWYRVFCKANNKIIPVQFQTDGEKAMLLDRDGI